MQDDTDNSDAGKDLQTIDDISAQHATLIGVIQRRSSSVKAVLHYWQNGSVTSALNALHMMNDVCVANDVLNSTFVKNLRIETLNYENITQLLPQTMQLVNSKYETHILSGLRSTLNILNHFAPQIIQLKTVAVGRGVDLAREERIRKCDACIEQFFQFKNCRGFQKALSRGGDVSQLAVQLENNL